jgi:hypothetical protein
LFAPEEFLQLMSKQAQPNGKVTGPDVGADISAQVSLAMDSGPIVSFNPGAGKSKSTFARTSDDQFKIKLGLKDDLTMDEPENLRKLLHSSKTLIQYLRDNPNSLLNRVYGIIRVTFADTDTYVILMSDAAYGQDKKLAERSDVRFEKYDLKGRSRNDLAAKNKPGSSTLINGEFMDWEGNTMHLSNNHCRVLQDVVKRDAEFLALHNLIDYSLFVTVATASLWESAEPLVVPVKLDHISLPGVVVSSTLDNTAAVVDQVYDHGYIAAFNKGLKEFGFVQGDAVRAVRAGDVITSVCHSDGVCAGTFDGIQDKLNNPPIGENFSIHVRRKQEPLGCGGTPGEPFCFESTQPHLDKRLGKMVLKTYTISIIDYLNQRNWFKRAEELVPSRYGKFSNYDGKIVDFVTEVCPVGLDDHVSDSFVVLPTGAAGASQHAESSS